MSLQPTREVPGSHRALRAGMAGQVEHLIERELDHMLKPFEREAMRAALPALLPMDGARRARVREHVIELIRGFPLPRTHALKLYLCEFEEACDAAGQSDNLRDRVNALHADLETRAHAVGQALTESRLQFLRAVFVAILMLP